MLNTSRSARAVLVALAPALAISGVIAMTGPAEAATVTGKKLLTQLDSSKERPAGYDRDLFRLWVDDDHDGCDTREEILLAESKVHITPGTGCRIATGRWVSWYDDKTWTKSSDVDIDHVVPLKEAWDSGAKTWTAERRSRYANDLGFAWSLDAVTDNVNQSKGERDPANWLPERQRCAYAIHWVAVKTRWNLTIDAAEEKVLAELLSGRCGKRKVTRPVKAPVKAPAPSVSVPTAPVTTTAPPPAPAPVTTTPVPAPDATVGYAVTPGAFCSERGSFGFTSAGTLMRCVTSSTDTRYRWRAA